MEQYAAKTILLSMAWDHEVAVDSITTDRSTSMRKMLEYVKCKAKLLTNKIKIFREIHSELPPEYTPPTHQFDIWHWIKVSSITSSNALVFGRLAPYVLINHPYLFQAVLKELWVAAKLVSCKGDFA